MQHLQMHSPSHIKKDKYQQSSQISNIEQGRLRIESSGGYVFYFFVCFIYLTPKEEDSLVRKLSLERH